MVAMFGAAAATGIPRWRSIKCLAKVAACAELPLAAGDDDIRRPTGKPSGEFGERRGEAIRLPAHGRRRLAQFRGHAGAEPCHVQLLS